MRASYQLVNAFKNNNGLRCIILLLYIVAVVQYFQIPQDRSVFIGMFRTPSDHETATMLTNLPALAFMTAGIALPLEQQLDFLLSPDPLIEIRRPRTWGRFRLYIAWIVVYSTTYTAVQALLSCHILARPASTLFDSSCCACLQLATLLVLLGTVRICINPAASYMIVALSYGTLLSLPQLQRWFAMMPSHWVPLLAILFISLCIANATAYKHMELL